jgi:hypothetical protein
VAGEARFEPPIREWMAKLRQTPDRVDLQVRKRFREISAGVRDDARSRASGGPPPSRIGRPRGGGSWHWKQLVSAIRSGSTSSSPHVSAGNAKVPGALGFEWGSDRIPRFPPRQREGYYVWPSWMANRKSALKEIGEALREGMRIAFPD